MHRSFYLAFTAFVMVSLFAAGCAAAPTTSTPTPAAQQPAAQAPSNTAEALPETGGSEAGAPASGELELPIVNPAEVEPGTIYIAGSSTVYPVTEAIAELFRLDGFAGEIKIDSIGSGAGFERFCKTGESDIANASRPIKASEVESCQALSPARTPIEFRVGTDALAVVINPANDFLTDVSMDELALIFSDKAAQWSDINPDWPAEDIQRFVPGTDSGTYDFFIEAVMAPAYDDAETGERAFLNAANLQQSEDDNVLVQGVEGNKYAIGFFGFAYYAENQGRLNVATVDGIEPNTETTETGAYPLARPLFIYSDATVMETKPQVAAFINFYLSNVNEIVTEVGYFPASEQALGTAKQAWLDAVE